MFACVALAVSMADPGLTFEKDVRPILKQHCFHCHGDFPKPKGGLDLRTVKMMVKGGESGAAITPGHADASHLWERVSTDEMPEGAKKLSARQKAILKQWIEQGAKTARAEPDDPNQARYTVEELSHWAFQPVKSVEPPQNKATTEIDRFLLDCLQKAGIDQFSPEVDRRTLIRRVTFDLHGLPPTPAEVDAFVNDQRPDAYAKLIDRLLASPRYGERWGRHWLDVAGYSETYGNMNKDQDRPNAWRYRDYVIAAFNQDKRFDEFLREQIAGDELAKRPFDPADTKTVEQLAATGFLRMAPDITGSNNELTDRNQAVADVIKITASAFLGLTVGCAQCHDHKYDPISAEDYYRFRAFFDPAFDLRHWQPPEQRVVDITPKEFKAKADAIEQQVKEKKADLEKRMVAHAKTILERELKKIPEADREPARIANELPDAKRTPAQVALLKAYPNIRSVTHIRNQLVEYDPPSHRQFTKEDADINQLRGTKPPATLLMTVQEMPGQVTPSRIHLRGDVAQQTTDVQPGELIALSHAGSIGLPRVSKDSPTTGRRLALAKHWTSGKHPLIARVFVNRVWLLHFGQGLVNTPGDFGINGDRPSHPELLDWLAEDFVKHDWQVKRLHRQLLMTRAYRQSSVQTPQLLKLDPDNKLLGRMNLRRLEAEALRDSMLLASGQLNVKQVGGPSIPVTEDLDGTVVLGKRKIKDGLFAGLDTAGNEDANRRSCYIQSKRALPLAMLEAFDLPTMSPNCELRRKSTASTQSLFLLNDPFVMGQSRAMAERLLREVAEPSRRIDLAFRTLFAIEPTPAERETCLAFVNAETQRAKQNTDKAWLELVKKQPHAAEIQALATLCQTLFCSNRFLYID
jgi:hypothetical protein